MFIQLTEYTIPFIESIIGIVKKEELEYQGVISRIVMILRNLDESSKPYEEIIVHEIDEKNRVYMRTALNRARFSLSAGNNVEGKINRILADFARLMITI